MPHADVEIAMLAWLASFAGRWPILDRLAMTVAHNDLFEAFPYVVILVGFWYAGRPRARATRRREVLQGFAAAAVAVLASRIVQNAVVTPRPIWNPAHAMLFPSGFRDAVDASFHSFPSDHVAFILPLAYSVTRLDHALGLAGAVWLLVITMVRVYLGLHYPVDVVGGVVLGAVATGSVRTTLAGRIDHAVVAARRAEARWPGWTAASLFVIAFQYATLFWLLRDLANRALRFWQMLG